MLDLDAVRPLIAAALAEDVGTGDVTSLLTVGDGARGRGRIVAKAHGVLAGVPVAVEAFRLAAGAEIEFAAEDGSRVAPGDDVLRFSGPARGLLAGERVALNFLSHMSGIASLTARFVAAVEGTGAKVLDTRKTLPGLRRLQKYAVVCGGGVNHRYALYDAMLVKENHLAFGADLAAALAARPSGMMAIVEAENLEEFRIARDAGADVVMVDEFSLEDVRRARDERGDAAAPQLEVSGGINLETIRGYAEAGADRISVGALTHSAPALDLSMRVVPLVSE
jgi:nicotinate-nucleotide pyrophosphorylase (carboxylating)